VLAARWQGPMHAPAGMTAAMALAPLPPVKTADKPTADRLRAALLDRHDIEVPVIARAERLWVRLSTQIDNEMSDVERLAEATETLLANDDY